MNSAIGTWFGVRLRHLEYLAAVARTGHFGDAATDLDVSQPALSQALARLEDVVGTPLFVAAGRRRVLTPAGREIAAGAAEVLRVVGRVRHRVEGRADGLAGSLAVGMIDAAALYLLRSAVDDFRRANPNIDLRVAVDASSELLRMLEAGEVDVAIVANDARDFVTVNLVDEGLFVYGPPVEHLRDIDRWILYPTGSQTRTVIDGALADMGIYPRIETETGNPSVMAELVRLGSGWTVLPAGVAESGPEPLVPIGNSIAERTIRAAVRPSIAEDPVVSRFLGHLVAGPAPPVAEGGLAG